MNRRAASEHLLGILHRNQYYVCRTPVWLAVLLNTWLLLCESLYYHTTAAGAERSMIPYSDLCWYRTVGHAVFLLLGTGHIAATVLRLVWLTRLRLMRVELQWTEARRWACQPALLLTAAGYFLGGPAGAIAFLVVAVALARFQSDFRRLHGVLFDTKTAQEVLFLVCGCLGIASSEYYFVPHMVELLDSGEVRLLLRATTLNLQKLGQTALVILIVVYFYATAGFRFFREVARARRALVPLLLSLGCAPPPPPRPR